MRRILISVLIIGAVIAAVAGSTFAYFSDTVQSTANEFTTGTLTLNIQDNDEGPNHGPVSATWKSPSNWAPGETFTSTVILKNAGNMPITYLGVDWTHPQGDAALLDRIQVVSWWEYNSTTGWHDYLDPNATPKQDYAHLIKTANPNYMTLLDLMKSYYGSEPLTSGGVENEFGQYVTHLTDTLKGNGYDIIPAGVPAIPVGGEFQIRMGLKLLEDTPNAFQGDSAKVDINFYGGQDISVFP
ncbi:MAG: CalY family protein [Chloroflexi bacterium]|nr:CalY family protein [Chloroflexota bacterium]